MKKGFIRLVWGDCSKNGLRDGKLHKDILDSIETGSFPFVIYVLGKDNFDYLSKLGLSCVLVSNDPLLFDVATQQWAHKLYLIKCAMEDYDAMIYLDWDCVETKKVHDGIWNILEDKESFQANLFLYRTKKCLWRDDEWRKVCNGGFLYIRDKSIPDKFITNYNELFEWTMAQQAKRQSDGKDLRWRERSLIYDDEPAITKYVDDFMGGWKGIDTYWDLFEPEISDVRRKSAYSEDKLKTKRYTCFMHNL